MAKNKLLWCVIIMFVFCCVYNQSFLSRINVAGLFVEISYMTFLAIGMTFVILTGGIDLSVGAVAGLSTVIVAYTMKNAYLVNDSVTILLAVFLALLCCTAIGFLNGAMVTFFDLPPLIVTLSVTWVAAGVANTLVKGTPLLLAIPSFRRILMFRIMNWVPVLFILTVLAVILLSYVFAKLRFGREIYAVGSSKYAAFISGMKVKRVLLRAYTLSGLFAGLTGLFIAANLSSGYATAAIDYELYTIAAVVMGGISLTGGEGKLINVFYGVIFLRLVKKVVVFTGLSKISGYMEGMIVGSILVLVLFFSFMKREETR
jgi:ribose transport system permease protein